MLRVRLPYAVPQLLAGMKTAATMALLGVVIGEFVTAQQGLGYVVMFAASLGETALVLAAITLLCGIGVALWDVIRAFQFDRTSAVLIMIVATVTLVDLFSARVRKLLI